MLSVYIGSWVAAGNNDWSLSPMDTLNLLKTKQWVATFRRVVFPATFCRKIFIFHTSILPVLMLRTYVHILAVIMQLDYVRNLYFALGVLGPVSGSRLDFPPFSDFPHFSISARSFVAHLWKLNDLHYLCVFALSSLYFARLEAADANEIGTPYSLLLNLWMPFNIHVRWRSWEKSSTSLMVLMFIFQPCASHDRRFARLSQFFFLLLFSRKETSLGCSTSYLNCTWKVSQWNLRNEKNFQCY